VTNESFFAYLRLLLKLCCVLQPKLLVDDDIQDHAGKTVRTITRVRCKFDKDFSDESDLNMLWSYYWYVSAMFLHVYFGLLQEL